MGRSEQHFPVSQRQSKDDDAFYGAPINVAPAVADSKPIDHLGILAAFATANPRSDHIGSGLKSWV